MPNTYRIQVITKDYVPELGHEYSDAQYFQVDSSMTIDEFRSQNESLIEAEKSKRIANWIDAIKNPPPPIERTREQLQEEKAELLRQIDDLDVRISGGTR